MQEGTYMAAQDVSLELLRVQLLGLRVITHKPLVSVRDVQATVQGTLCTTYIHFIETCASQDQVQA